MSNAGTALALVAVALLLLVGIATTSASYREAGQEFTSDNESWTPDAGNWTTLQNSNLDDVHYSQTVEVYDDQVKEVTLGEDYEWNETNGTVYTVPGGKLDGANSATITYSWYGPTDEQRSLRETMSSGYQAASYLPLVLLISLVVGSIALLGRL